MQKMYYLAQIQQKLDWIKDKRRTERAKQILYYHKTINII